MYTKALVRKPGRSLMDGLTTANLGKPEYGQAVDQHAAYIEALKACGLEVHILPPLEEFPDSCFIEDAAILIPSCAIITRPGAPSRLGEIAGMEEVLGEFYDSVEQINAPGTLEGGDILRAGSHFYIGLSERTNSAGARQLMKILERNGYSCSALALEGILHLKTGISYLENNTLLAWREMLSREEFSGFNSLSVPEGELYAANCIWINGTVLVPAGFPQTSGIIQEAGFPVLEVEVSEFRKLDGGLSCLSLRF